VIQGHSTAQRAIRRARHPITPPAGWLPPPGRFFLPLGAEQAMALLVSRPMKSLRSLADPGWIGAGQVGLVEHRMISRSVLQRPDTRFGERSGASTPCAGIHPPARRPLAGPWQAATHLIGKSTWPGRVSNQVLRM